MKYLMIILLGTFSFSLMAQDDGFVQFMGKQEEYHLNGSATIYSLPDTESSSSKLKDRLEYFKILSHNKDWYKIRYSAYGTDEISTGYVTRDAVYNNGIYVAHMKTLHYELYAPEDDHAVLFSVVDYDTKQTTDTLHMYNNYHGFEVLDIGRTHLKGAENLVNFRTFRESCPGLTSNDFVLIDKEGKMKLFANSTSTGEAGWNELEELYLPVKFGNGTVKLILNGDIKNMINWETGEAMEIKNPETYGIPLDELVIMKTYYSEPLFDENDNEMLDPDGEPTLFTETEGYIIYRWDGEKLTEVKYEED